MTRVHMRVSWGRRSCNSRANYEASNYINRWVTALCWRSQMTSSDDWSVDQPSNCFVTAIYIINILSNNTEIWIFSFSCITRIPDMWSKSRHGLQFHILGELITWLALRLRLKNTVILVRDLSNTCFDAFKAVRSTPSIPWRRTFEAIWHQLAHQNSLSKMSLTRNLNTIWIHSKWSHP